MMIPSAIKNKQSLITAPVQIVSGFGALCALAALLTGGIAAVLTGAIAPLVAGAVIRCLRLSESRVVIAGTAVFPADGSSM